MQFIEAPYLRDVIAEMGFVAETFETCVTWREWPALHRALMTRVRAAISEHLGSGRITCRLVSGCSECVRLVFSTSLRTTICFAFTSSAISARNTVRLKWRTHWQRELVRMSSTFWKVAIS